MIQLNLIILWYGIENHKIRFRKKDLKLISRKKNYFSIILKLRKNFIFLIAFQTVFI